MTIITIYLQIFVSLHSVTYIEQILIFITYPIQFNNNSGCNNS